MNLPNTLSAIRIALIPLFCWVYLSAEKQPWFFVAALILLVSGVTDLLDGLIARRFHLITQLGKILDPLADKLTQGAVCICLGIRYPELWLILGLFLLKEVLMLAGGVKLYRRYKALDGAKWFGKLYTVVFYVIMLLIVALPNLKAQLVLGLLIIMAVFMLFAFIMYVPVFLRLIREEEK